MQCWAPALAAVTLSPLSLCPHGSVVPRMTLAQKCGVSFPVSLLPDLELDWKMQGGNWFSPSPAPHAILFRTTGRSHHLLQITHGTDYGQVTVKSLKMWFFMTFLYQQELCCRPNYTGTVSRNTKSVSVPQPPSSMCDGTIETWFLEPLPLVGSSDASGRA